MNLVWFHNNLRCADNAALTAACAGKGRVIALYCFDPKFFQRDANGFLRTEKFRAQFLLQSLQDLRRQLRALNIPLIIRRGFPADEITALATDCGIRDIYLQQEWTRDERIEIGHLRTHRQNQTLKLHAYYDQFLVHPDDLPYGDVSEIPEVFTAFRKVVEANWNVRAALAIPPACPAENRRAPVPEGELPTLVDLGLDGFSIDPRSAFPFAGGSTAGAQRLTHYFWQSENITRYKQTRNGLIGTEYSSKLSPWLANGSLSPRQVYWALRAFERDVIANEDTYWLVFELLWRDFFKYISRKHCDRIFSLNGIRGQEYDWHHDTQTLQNWIRGETQYDFINANMRELALTGWMSNRGRQNVASFWAREMKQDWRIGAAWFESLLIDYDVHSNYGNWMYNSGVGNAPRDRRFNIQRQAEQYDPGGSYRQLWCNPQTPMQT
ncbi:DASH family cryptochrome [Microbulbifer sp. SA54]|uniref:DASH family cryptochrome n=1 Tax=Microbulbifer sp. SA54 TaxID=3401577 RepID=UPI003AABA9B3